MLYLFDSNMHSIINLFAENEIPLPDYLQTVMKKQILNGEILMVWSKNNIIIRTNKLGRFGCLQI